MQNSIEPTLTALQRLIEVVTQLRSPTEGCPWDLAQTPQSLTPYVIEEAYEVVDAIAQGEPEAIADELGDLLLQVVLQAQIASEAQQFDLAKVAEGITAKLIRRHPHVFGDGTADSIEAVKDNWEQIKSTENPDQSLLTRLRRYARSLPPLTASMKISQKAVAIGFEWENADQVWEKLKEELGEFKQAIAHKSPENQQAELGDVLFTLVNIARWYQLDPDAALAGTNQRFIARLTQMEAQADRPLEDYSIEELEQLWQQAKKELSAKSQE